MAGRRWHRSHRLARYAWERELALHYSRIGARMARLARGVDAHAPAHSISVEIPTMLGNRSVRFGRGLPAAGMTLIARPFGASKEVDRVSR
ncbi:MAG: hypothetical protein JO282_11430 [Alphaproteobacteria bacterium]|nr:hypothetical protein [Alphaproteobacteria bacterium]